MHRGLRNERQNLDTERHGIPPQPPWFFNVPRVKLRFTGQTFTSPSDGRWWIRCIFTMKWWMICWSHLQESNPGLPLERRDVEPLDHRGSHEEETSCSVEGQDGHLCPIISIMGYTNMQLKCRVYYGRYTCITIKRRTNALTSTCMSVLVLATGMYYLA